MKRSTCLLATLLLPLAACAPPGQLPAGGGFAIARLELPGAAPATAVVPAGQPAPAVVGASLTVDFAPLLRPAARRLSAVVADVETVRIKLTGPGVDQTATVAKAQIAAGQTSHTFTGLPPGALTVTVEALDLAGAVIGRDVRSATVTVGATVTVATTVQLTPAAPVPRPLPTTGDLQVDVTLVDGKPVVTPPVAGIYHLGALPSAALDPRAALHVAVDALGQAWFTGAGSVATTGSGDLGSQAYLDELGRLGRVAADGSLHVESHGVTTTGLVPTFLDPIDAIGGAAMRVDLNGTSSARMSSGGSAARRSFGPIVPIRGVESIDGTNYILHWTANYLAAPDGQNEITLSRMPPGGTRTALATQRSQGANDIAVALDLAGDVIFGGSYGMVADGPAGLEPRTRIRKLHPDGSEVFTLTFPGRATFAVGPTNGLIVLEQYERRLHFYQADGSKVAERTLAIDANRLAVSRQGDIYAYFGGEFASTDFWLTPGVIPDQVIARLGFDGTLQDYYHVGQGVDISEIAADRNDLWVASPKQGLIHLKLGIYPLFP